EECRARVEAAGERFCFASSSPHQSPHHTARDLEDLSRNHFLVLLLVSTWFSAEYNNLSRRNTAQHACQTCSSLTLFRRLPQRGHALGACRTPGFSLRSY